MSMRVAPSFRASSTWAAVISPAKPLMTKVAIQMFSSLNPIIFPFSPRFEQHAPGETGQDSKEAREQVEEGS
jgi:hypothetical protein